MNTTMTTAITTLLWLMATVSASTAVEPSASRQPASEVRDVARRILAEPEFRHFEHFADDAFRRGEPTPSPTESPSTSGTESNNTGEGSTPTSTDPKTSSSTQEPWWKRALNRSQPSKSDNNSGSSRNQRLSPSGTSPANGDTSTKSEPTTKGSPTESKTNANANDGTVGQSSNQPNGGPTSSGDAAPPAGAPSGRAERGTPSTERPTRAGNESTARASRTTRPAQRGSDGVERPVRQATRTARTPTPEPTSRGPEMSGFSLGLGNLLGGLFHGLAYLILVVIVVGIIVLIGQALAQAWNDRPRNVPGMSASTIGPLTHDRSPGETEADVFVQEALALAQRGEFRAAIGKLVLGGMSFIERQQWIRYRRGLTVHDYLRVLRSRPEQFAGFRQVVHVFEPVEYGRQLATEPLFDAALKGYRRGFQRPVGSTVEEPA